MHTHHVRDLGERLIATFALAFLAYAFATKRGDSVHWLDAAGVGGFALIAVVVTTVAMWLLHVRVADPLLDLLLRATLTFLQFIGAAMVAAGPGNLFTFHWSTVLLAALGAAAGSAFKGLAGIANAGTLGASVAVPRRAIAA